VPASGDNEDIVEKQMECRLAGETEVLGENLPQRHKGLISHSKRKGHGFRVSELRMMWKLRRSNRRMETVT
jgi:hypothetical protein